MDVGAKIDAITGPYRTPPDGGVLVPQGHYAGRICRWRGEDVYFCWHKPDFGLPYDFPGARNPAGKFVVAPLALVPRSDGSLATRTFSGWRAYTAGDATTPTAAPHSLYGDRDTGSAFRAEAPNGANDVVATAEDAEHFLLQGVLHLDAEGGGYFVEVTTGGTEVKLLKWLPTPREGRPYFTYTVLQRGRLRAPAAPDAPLPFALLVVGAYIEVTLGDEVVLCTLSAERTRGPVGLWAQSGTAHAEELRLTPMRVPEHGSNR